MYTCKILFFTIRIHFPRSQPMTAATLYCSGINCPFLHDTIVYNDKCPRALAALWAACALQGLGHITERMCSGHVVVTDVAAVNGGKVLLIDMRLSPAEISDLSDRCKKVLVIAGSGSADSKQVDSANVSYAATTDLSVSQATWLHFCPRELRGKSIAFLDTISDLVHMGVYEGVGSLATISRDMVHLGHWRKMYRGTTLQPLFEFNDCSSKRKRGGFSIVIGSGQPIVNESKLVDSGGVVNKPAVNMVSTIGSKSRSAMLPSCDAEDTSEDSGTLFDECRRFIGAPFLLSDPNSDSFRIISAAVANVALTKSSPLNREDRSRSKVKHRAQ